MKIPEKVGGNFLTPEKTGSGFWEGVVKAYGTEAMQTEDGNKDYYYLILENDGEEYKYRLRATDFQTLRDEGFEDFDELVGKTIVIKAFTLTSGKFSGFKTLKIITVKKDKDDDGKKRGK